MSEKYNITLIKLGEEGTQSMNGKFKPNVLYELKKKDLTLEELKQFINKLPKEEGIFE